jgi:hypothetical protein
MSVRVILRRGGRSSGVLPDKFGTGVNGLIEALGVRLGVLPAFGYALVSLFQGAITSFDLLVNRAAKLT